MPQTTAQPGACILVGRNMIASATCVRAILLTEVKITEINIEIYFFMTLVCKTTY